MSKLPGTSVPFGRLALWGTLWNNNEPEKLLTKLARKNKTGAERVRETRQNFKCSYLVAQCFELTLEQTWLLWARGCFKVAVQRRTCWMCWMLITKLNFHLTLVWTALSSTRQQGLGLCTFAIEYIERPWSSLKIESFIECFIHLLRLLCYTHTNHSGFESIYPLFHFWKLHNTVPVIVRKGINTMEKGQKGFS